jgi:hypothetical protein
MSGALNELGQVPATAFPAAARIEDPARAPVVGNISLHVLISEHTVQERITCSMDLDTASAKEIYRLFDARISGPLSGKS